MSGSPGCGVFCRGVPSHGQSLGGMRDAAGGKNFCHDGATVESYNTSTVSWGQTLWQPAELSPCNVRGVTSIYVAVITSLPPPKSRPFSHNQARLKDKLDVIPCSRPPQIWPSVLQKLRPNMGRNSELLINSHQVPSKSCFLL